MELVLQGLTRSICMIYLDDILIFSRTFTEHISHLTQVFHRLHMANSRLKPRKCRFGQSTVNYLRHVVSEKGIAVDPTLLKMGSRSDNLCVNVATKYTSYICIHGATVANLCC